MKSFKPRSVALFSFFPVLAVFVMLSAKNGPNYESYWVKKLSHRLAARTEVVLDDGSRIDLLNKNMAAEVDWAGKWYEAVGQSLYYGCKKDRAPYIFLLVRNKKDMVYARRCQVVCDKYGIGLYVVSISGGKIESLVKLASGQKADN